MQANAERKDFRNDITHIGQNSRVSRSSRKQSADLWSQKETVVQSETGTDGSSYEPMIFPSQSSRVEVTHERAPDLSKRRVAVIGGFINNGKIATDCAKPIRLGSFYHS